MSKTNKHSAKALIIAAIVVAGGGGAFAMLQKDNTDKKVAHDLAMKHDEAMKKDQAVDKTPKPQNAVAENTNESNAPVKGSYTAYDPAKLANASTGKVVLNFSAPWCPICREAESNFKASKTPDGLTLLKVDYDSSTALKKKYGVTYQHTFVQVDKAGNLLKKWSASTTYGDIQKQVI